MKATSMSQFLYQQAGKGRFAPIIHDTIKYELTGCTGTVYWTSKPTSLAFGSEVEKRKFYDSFLPLTEQRGFLQGVTALQPRIDELHGQFAELNVTKDDSPLATCFGALSRSNSIIEQITRDTAVIAAIA